MLESSFSKDQMEGTIAAQRDHIQLLRSRLTIALEALKAIEEHEHSRQCNVERTINDPYKRGYQFGKAFGHMEGHRCCATIASEGLKRMEEVK